jgi:hypothetical protein
MHLSMQRLRRDSLLFEKKLISCSKLGSDGYKLETRTYGAVFFFSTKVRRAYSQFCVRKNEVMLSNVNVDISRHALNLYCLSWSPSRFLLCCIPC